ncbi:hypothetical protein [Cytobacillus purgationiresistens]|uniref:Uncharacterized protein n=1 Tax=Cytobacillus purgationiresistens TaxID=863449 RepID=A0ABU0ADZ3_9BACI|nr:hypothetical protein [Cytobacillus purgationiresistens]MDQ0268668.1 hypothetical protein [Cytobacillus purgationiresistens]
MIDNFYIFENGIILTTIKDYIQNNNELKELINKNIQNEFESYFTEFGIDDSGIKNKERNED